MSSKWVSKVKTNQTVGKTGEDLAIAHLKSSGFDVVERNFRTRFGEIDIVAQKGRDYFFVEVKTRTQKEFGAPVEAIPFFRLERLKRMAQFYAVKKGLMENNLHLSLLGIDLSAAAPKIDFLPNILE